MTPVLSAAVIVGVALGGALGAVARLLLDRMLPFGILTANTVGCFALGYLFGEFSTLTVSGPAPETGPFSEPVMTVLAFGLIGTLSTFATVSVRAAELWMNGQRLHASGLWTIHVSCGFAAAAVGIALSSL